MSAKMPTPDLLRIMVFSNKGSDIITPVYDIIKKFYQVIQLKLLM